MSELEQLRKEVNELRERIAKLEAGHAPWPHVPPHWPQYAPNTITPQTFPPGTVIC